MGTAAPSFFVPSRPLFGKMPPKKEDIMKEELLLEYLKFGKGGQTPHSLEAAFAFHVAFKESGDMSKVDWSRYGF